MNLYRLKFSELKINDVYIVDKIDNFFSYNKNFITDGEKFIKGDEKIEYHVSDATYITFPERKIYLCTEQGYEKLIKKGEINK